MTGAIVHRVRQLATLGSKLIKKFSKIMNVDQGEAYAVGTGTSLLKALRTWS